MRPTKNPVTAAQIQWISLMSYPFCLRGEGRGLWRLLPREGFDAIQALSGKANSKKPGQLGRSIWSKICRMQEPESSAQSFVLHLSSSLRLDLGRVTELYTQRNVPRITYQPSAGPDFGPSSIAVRLRGSGSVTSSGGDKDTSLATYSIRTPELISYRCPRS
jgi:hypothetical protein